MRLARDFRDPAIVGERLLAMKKRRKSLDACECADLVLARDVPDYHSDLGPIEKYGDPRKLPSALPN